MRAGGAGGTEITSVAALPDGSGAIVTGFYTGKASFGDTSLASSDGEDIFVARVDASGQWVWAARGGSTGNDRSNSVAVTTNASGEFTGAVVAGYVSDAATFDSINLSIGQIARAAFVARIDDGGSWASVSAPVGDPGETAEAVSIAAVQNASGDFDGAIISGDFSNEVFFPGENFGSAPGRFGSPTGGDHVFVARLGADGFWKWADVSTGNGSARSGGVDVIMNADGTLAGAVLSGWFGNSVTFDRQVSSSGGDDAFVARINPNGLVGAWQWVATAGGTGADVATSIATFTKANGAFDGAVVTGYFSGAASFTPVTDGAVSVTSAGGRDVFVAQITEAEGEGRWVQALSAGGNGNAQANGLSLIPKSTGGFTAAFLTGTYRDTANFGANELVGESGRDNLFVARIDGEGSFDPPPPPPPSVDMRLTAQVLEEPNNVVTLPLRGTVDVEIDWGDGAPSGCPTTVSEPGDVSCAYTTPGTYTISIDQGAGTGPWLTQFGAGTDTYPNAARITGVVEFGQLGIESLSGAFRNAVNLTAMSRSLPEGVSDLSEAFRGATRFNRPIGGWDTSNVTDMSNMFWGARAFNRPIGDWDTSKVTDMSNMFRDAAVFNQPIGGWDTSKVTDLSGTFWDARAFNRDIGDWETGAVTDMSNMFRNALAFNRDIGAWDTSNVTSMRSMFNAGFIKADGAFNQNLSAWDTGAVTDMSAMFEATRFFNNGCTGTATSCRLTWDTSSVTTMQSMFATAVAFNQDIGTWDTSKVTFMRSMFDNRFADSSFGVPPVFNRNIGGWDTSAVTDMSSMFIGAAAFNRDIGGWDTRNVIGMDNMFTGATSFNRPIGGWNTGKVVNMGGMFANTAAFNQPIGNWNTSSVTNMGGMFTGATSFNQPIGGWNTSGVVAMFRMFDNTSAFNQPIGNWNTSSVTNMNSTFFGATAFNQNIRGWSTTSVTSCLQFSASANPSWANDFARQPDFAGRCSR